MLTRTRPPVAVVVQQHQADCAALRVTRSVLVRAAHVRLHHLGRLDERLAAHVDGLVVAGRFGSRHCEIALESPGVGEVFAATLMAIEQQNSALLERMLALAEALPHARRGLVSAFGWVSAHGLRGLTQTLLASPDAFRRHVGLAACAMHRRDPGPALDVALADADASLRARALRAAGDCGRVDLLADCLRALGDAQLSCRFEAARAASLLGDRAASVVALQALASMPSHPYRAAALQVLLKVLAPPQVNAVLKALSHDDADLRMLIRAVGVGGDPHYMPWLIKQMEDAELARLAGESFSFITGLDLAYLDLDRKPPESRELGPNDDPVDDDVAMDDDDGLPWPDPAKIAAWWKTEGPRFAPGTHYFVGEPPTLAHCLRVLKSGFQRQRLAAAHYLCLMRPGVPLFNTAAPAWRQQRWLNSIGA